MYQVIIGLQLTVHQLFILIVDLNCKVSGKLSVSMFVLPVGSVCNFSEVSVSGDSLHKVGQGSFN